MRQGVQKEYKRMAADLKGRIRSGEFPAGGRLPTERELSGAMGVSRVTTRSALQELEKEGLVVRRQGAGTFVSELGAMERALEDNSICLAFTDHLKVGIAEEPYVAMLLDGLRRATAKLGFRISLLPVPEDLSLLELMREKPDMAPSSKGVILSLRKDFDASLAWLKGRGHAVVSMGFGDLNSAEHSCVDIDNRAGGLMAARRLLSLGRRSLAFIDGASGDAALERRLEGIRTAHEEAGLAFDETKFFEATPWSEADGHSAVRRLLDSGAAFDSLIVHGDLATLGALKALAGAGRRVPEDVSLVMYDDFPWLQRVSPVKLSAVRQPFDEMAESAAEMLLEAMGKLNPPVKIKILQPSLIIRDSCGRQLSN